MANEIIVKYLSDKTVPVEKRRQVADALNSGKMSENTAVHGISAKYGEKYGKQPTAAGMMGAAMGLLGNPAELMSRAGQAAAQKAPDIIQRAGKMRMAVESNMTPEEKTRAAEEMASMQQDNEYRAQLTRDLTAKFGTLPDELRKTLETASVETLKREEQKLKMSENPMAEIGAGVTKGVASTVMGASELVGRGMDAAVRALGAEKLGYKKPDFDEMENLRQSLTRRSNELQEIGFTGEQIAEFFLPAGIIGKGAKAVEGATGAAKIAGFGKKVLDVGAKAAMEGAAAGTVAAAQEGDVTPDVAAAAGFAASLPVVSAVLGKAANFIKNQKVKAARNEIAKLIKPAKNAYLFGKDPAEAVARKGIVANSWDDLVKKIGNAKDEAGESIKSAVKAAPKSKTVKISDLIKKNLDDFAKKNADSATQKTYVTKVQDLINKTVPDLKSGGAKVVGKVNLNKMNANQLWEFQKKIGKLTKWTGEVGENEANKQLHKLYRAVGNRLEQLAPGTKAARLEYANFLGAEKAAVARAAVATSNTNALVQVASAGTSGAIAGVTTSGDLGKTLATVGFGAILPMIVRSPAFKTRVAKFLAAESGQSAKAVSDVLSALAKYGISTLDTKSKVQPQ